MPQFAKLSHRISGAFFIVFVLTSAHLEVVKGRAVNGRKNLIEISKEGKEVTAPSGFYWSRKEQQELMIEEECYLPETCIDEDTSLLACLKNPGHESFGLLFLILQNKGNKPVTITIAAPGFVQLEQAMVQLEANHRKQVTITPGYDGVDSLIILTTDEGRRCSLDFRESMISQNITTMNL